MKHVLKNHITTQNRSMVFGKNKKREEHFKY